jgi:hypothetical protein
MEPGAGLSIQKVIAWFSTVASVIDTALKVKPVYHELSH